MDSLQSVLGFSVALSSFPFHAGMDPCPMSHGPPVNLLGDHTHGLHPRPEGDFFNCHCPHAARPTNLHLSGLGEVSAKDL